MDESMLIESGKKEWDEDGKMIDKVLATLRDYFDDIKQWIPAEYIFPKILKHCLDLVLRLYIKAFFTNTLANGLQNVSNATEKIQTNWAKLWGFFGTDCQNYHGHAGFYDKANVWYRLHILEAMIAVLSTKSDPEKIHIQISALVQQLGTDNSVPAILHLVGLQRRRIRAKEGEEWHGTIAAVIENSKAKTPEPLYRIVDLRNSKFIRRMKPSRQIASKKVKISPTNQLVQNKRRRILVNKIFKRSKSVMGSDDNMVST